jgi:AcrR family transcriptional regulator
VALRLFGGRGYEAVTVNEAAEVAIARLFECFPTKEFLLLQGVGDDDLAGIVSARGPGTWARTAWCEYWTTTTSNAKAFGAMARRCSRG